MISTTNLITQLTLEDDAKFLDKTNIISSGRRTRGKRVDYSKFGPDSEQDEE